PMLFFPSKSMIISEPFGNTLIIAPWNYPFQLLMCPLVAALAAGNTVVLKSSPYTPSVAKVLETIVNDAFDNKLVAIFDGGREVNTWLLQQRWDFIFFTGSPQLGRIIMQAAVPNLTPVVLELGGKSPCIVDEDANLKLAAKRIVWGKFLNAGQTCIAPDYMFVHQNVKDELLTLMQAEIQNMFGENPQESPDFPRIVSHKAMERLEKLIHNGRLVCGGDFDAEKRYIAPTIFDEIQPEDPIMQEEIFGPLMPVMTFTDITEVVEYLHQNEKPLAFYYFTKNRKKAKKILGETTSGGGVINDTIIHVANSKMPFGGVGNSGMGNYHGKFGFDTFSHQRAVAWSSSYIDIPLKYAPYQNRVNLVRKFMK
ncbi:MAG: aldehyde dehydrogenase family protein, partial [Bacteroidales bacterium]|nr:aldehyde dehydrogenase family protein [Bacteroidales bacterium]